MLLEGYMFNDFIQKHLFVFGPKYFFSSKFDQDFIVLINVLLSQTHYQTFI